MCVLNERSSSTGTSRPGWPFRYSGAHSGLFISAFPRDVTVAKGGAPLVARFPRRASRLSGTGILIKLFCHPLNPCPDSAQRSRATEEMPPRDVLTGVPGRDAPPEILEPWPDRVTGIQIAPGREILIPRTIGSANRAASQDPISWSEGKSFWGRKEEANGNTSSWRTMEVPSLRGTSVELDFCKDRSWGPSVLNTRIRKLPFVLQRKRP